MKKLIFWIIVIAGIAILFYFIKDWQPVSMVIAALAAPFKFLYKLFGDKEEEIRKKHAEIRQRELEYQGELESNVQKREQKIGDLEDQLAQLDKKLVSLDEQRQKIDRKVESMSLDELQEAGQNFFGD